MSSRCRPAKSSDEVEDLPLFGSFCKSSAFPIYFEILPIFPKQTYYQFHYFCAVWWCQNGKNNLPRFPHFYAKRRKIFCLYIIKCWKVCLWDRSHSKQTDKSCTGNIQPHHSYSPNTIHSHISTNIDRNSIIQLVGLRQCGYNIITKFLNTSNTNLYFNLPQLKHI